MLTEDSLIRKPREKVKNASRDRIVKIGLAGVTYFIVLAALMIFGKIIIDGAPVLLQKDFPFINTSFIFDKNETLHVFDNADGQKMQLAATDYNHYIEENGEDGIYNHLSFSYSGGGIVGPIVGTAMLTLGAMGMALFFGVAAAIYLSEYAHQGKFVQIVRLAILNLAGVPSIVFGLFGFAVFVLAVPVITMDPSSRSMFVIPLFVNDWVISFQGWNSCLLSGCATLCCMILPVVITASEESLSSVPRGFREASLALGATRWQTIRKSVLPFALPGILTSSLLSIARVAGETAPIMFTAAVAAKDMLPWEDASSPLDVLQSQVQALPYHIYTLAARLPNSEYTQNAQYGSVFVFLLLVAIMSIASMILRAKLRSKLKW